ncbi:hypothetical protein JVU11DRAFT_43 [Chiua virens]|nr:hypothetical protein JVU11DRAFT_43 [Chiua virens]
MQSSIGFSPLTNEARGAAIKEGLLDQNHNPFYSPCLQKLKFLSPVQLVMSRALYSIAFFNIAHLRPPRLLCSSERQIRHAAFESTGVKTLIGSYDDHALLEKQASLSDVIIASADADNAEACAAILRGLKKRYEATGKAPILIHTSGTAIIMDDTQGNYETETVWDDTDVAKLDTIPNTQLHRNVDTLILTADREGYVKTYFVLPSTIYGFATGTFVDLGVQNKRSIQLPLVVSACSARKRGGYVGKGLNAWPDVHIDDIADLYIVLYDAILEGKAGHGREGFYFGENGHYLFKDAGAKIGEVLYELGVSETSEPSPFTDEDYKQFPMERTVDARQPELVHLDGSPSTPTEDMMKSLKGEVEWQLKHASGA